MKKHRINCPLIIESVPGHDKNKSKFLSLIDQSSGSMINDDNDYITRTDYYCDSESKLYRPLAISFIQNTISKILNSLIDEKTCRFYLKNVWYQQYFKTDTHDWHHHLRSQKTAIEVNNSVFSVIYYLELPKGTPGTEFRDPYTGRSHFPKVKEGDLILFPSFINHRSPPNKSDKRKTIISTNIK